MKLQKLLMIQYQSKKSNNFPKYITNHYDERELTLKDNKDVMKALNLN